MDAQAAAYALFTEPCGYKGQRTCLVSGMGCADQERSAGAVLGCPSASNAVHQCEMGECDM